MATKPRAAKAPSKPVAARRAASSAPEPAPKPAAKVGKTVAKTPVKAAANTVKRAAKVASKPAAKPAAKSAAKSTAKPVAKPAVKRAATPAAALKRAAKAVVASAVTAAGNPSLVRDSFTMPEAEYAVFASTKQRCLKAGVEIKKSELLRIGMALVGQLDVATLQAVLAGLPQLKTGRPRSE